MFLTTDFNFCDRSITLDWNPYTGWPAAPSYEILLSVNGGPETVIGNTTSTSFADTNLVSGSTYCYRVRAVDQSIVARRTSTSNRSCQSPTVLPTPAFSYIRSVSVGPEDFVTIKAYVDPNVPVSSYELLRSTSPTTGFSRVNSITITGVSNIVFTDNVKTSEGPYYYKINTIDSCGKKVLESQVSKTILLSGEALEQYQNSLIWNSYSSWPTGVDVYHLYLTVNGVTTVLPLQSFQPGDSTYLESVMNNYYSDGKFCYYIEAIENQGNPYFFLDTSRSNEVCIIQEPNIFIPNAFHPGGDFNQRFYPSNAFVSTDNYTLLIFNRWGETVFETHDPQVGWDGTSHGISAPEAVYIYLLKAQQADGSTIERKGSVTLIR
jgi:gliding motility-associated-like protein